jgi:hypothetical protein
VRKFAGVNRFIGVSAKWSTGAPFAPDVAFGIPQSRLVHGQRVALHDGDEFVDAASVEPGSVIYDGPARGIAAKFPRNVNTMVTCAFATIGLDRCRARLIAAATPDLGVCAAEA